MDKPEPPHEDYPESWDTFYRTVDGEKKPHGRTDDGKEFAFDTGSPTPVEDRCNAPVRDYERRYGEVRYCTRLPAGKFGGYESDYCKTHLAMDTLEERAHELFEHGHFVESYVQFASHLSPTKFLFAIEMVGGLFKMSQYDFEIENEYVLLETDESELIEEDAVEAEIPIPTASTYSFQADQLWQAALAEVEMRNMREVVFRDNLTRESYAATADDNGVITDTRTEEQEHHLHLPISRLTKDIKEHLKNGGVDIDTDDESGSLTFQKNDYTLSVEPKEETDSDATQSVSEVSEEFSESLESTDEKAVIDIDD